MNEDLKKKIIAYNAQVPRYTSYPTAPHFKPLAAPDYAAWLESADTAEAVSIYVHIPFCTEMCWYCGCHTTATRKYAPLEDYVTLLRREMKLVAERLPRRLSAGHIHFGGGSPSMLSPYDFTRIMDTLGEIFDIAPDAEIAIEADPRGVTHDRAEAYAHVGVNRASFGIQDFAPQVQAAINRIQSFDTVARAAERLRDFGITRLNFDLMYGLPRQGLEDVADTARKSLSLAPDRIALFGYAHVPWMKKHMRLIRDEDLPQAAARLEQFALSESLLLAAGMEAVGLDHFCTAGDDMLRARDDKRLARNFQGYTTDRAPVLLGFGLSSIGRVSEGFVQNHPHITDYSKAVLEGTLPAARGIALTAEDTLRAKIISDLMCYLSADVGAVLQSHDQCEDRFDAVLDGLADLAADGLVRTDGRRVEVRADARQMVRVVAARFDAYFGGETKRHVQAA